MATWNLGRLRPLEKQIMPLFTGRSFEPGLIKSSLISYTQAFGFGFSTRLLILDVVRHFVHASIMCNDFDELLLDHIKNQRNEEAEAMLNEELAQAFNDSDAFGTLLVHAISSKNHVIARRLIELGADVNRFRSRGPSPLTLAMANEDIAAIEILLQAGARVDLSDGGGNNPLWMGLQFVFAGSRMFKLLVSKLRTKARTIEELAKILTRCGCNMYHAVTLGNVDLMECMLRRGADVNWRGPNGFAALPAAAALDDLSLTEWLLKRGANVDSLDDHQRSTLYRCAMHGQKAMVQLLLEHGACPDGKSDDKDDTPLVAAFQRLLALGRGAGLPENTEVDLVELLLQHGASLPSSDLLKTWFQATLDLSYDKAAKLLVAHMAMLEKLGKPVGESVLLDGNGMSELRKYYASCQQILSTKVFENMSLLDLLNESDGKLKLLVRKETFLQEVERVSSEHKFKELYPYYYNTMIQRIDKASRMNNMGNHFDKLLVDLIKKQRNGEALAMLTRELARMFDDSDDYRTLLNHAIANDNIVIVRKLIELGADINRIGGRLCPTPLTLAIRTENAAAVEVLLKAGARLDLLDNGLSPLLVGLQCTHVNHKIFNLLVAKLKTLARTNDELAEILIRAGCSMYHAAALRDVDLMECMLQRGVDVNSKAFMGMTALHGAGILDDVNMADWLLKKGADIDALDDNGCSSLFRTVMYGSKAMVQFLLEHGACPDGKSKDKDHTPFVAAFQRLLVPLWGAGLPESVELFEPVELLLQHGASLPLDFALVQTWFQAIVLFSYDRALKLLLAHMAMLEKLSKPVDKSPVRAVGDNFPTKESELWKYYESCQQILSTEVFENTSLLNLLNESDDQLRLLVRKERFLQEVDKFSSEHKLSESYSYYYNTMMKRIEKASRVVK